MARSSWFDERTELPRLEDQVAKLESFREAMSDGRIEKEEVEKQQGRLTRIMKEVEPLLNEDLHAKVTELLVELTAYNIMRTIHELHVERARMAVD